MNSSSLNISTTVNPIRGKASDTPLIVGLTIAAAVIAVICCICCCLKRHEKFCFKKKAKTKKRESLTDVATIPTSREQIPSFHPTPPKTAKEVLTDGEHPHISISVAELSKPKTLDRCPMDVCKQYSINLRMSTIYFNFQHNRCFCHLCYSSTKTDTFTVAGSVYTAPRGWVRFGLRVDQAFADGNQIFKRWYTTFYGTSKDKLHCIIDNRFIPLPGDSLLHGEKFTTHLSDQHHIYTSPSIYYAYLKHVCPIHTTKINENWYDVQVVLECKQNPQGIRKQRGYRSNVCHIIPDNEIEWKTNLRSSVVPYGLLIHAQRHQCTIQCAQKHSK